MIKDMIRINPGITAVIGSGGKTSLIRRLAEEICPESKAVICTTTHIMRPDDIPVYEVEISEEFIDANDDHSTMVDSFASFISDNTGKPICAGVTDPDSSEKLISFPIDIIKQAAGENTYILVEADGAKHMPMKAHNEYEPVIPEGCDRVILVIGAEGFGKMVGEVVHRPRIFAGLAETDLNAIVTPKLLAKVLKAERSKFGDCRLQVIVNRTNVTESDGYDCTETENKGINDFYENDTQIAKEIAELTGWEVYAGNVAKGTIVGCG